jgi:hypothetical protein
MPPVPVKSLADIVALADTARHGLQGACEALRAPGAHRPGRIDVNLTDDAPKMLLNDLTAKLRAWTGATGWCRCRRKRATDAVEMGSTKRENTSSMPGAIRLLPPSSALSGRQDHRRSHSRRAGSRYGRGRPAGRARGGRRRDLMHDPEPEVRVSEKWEPVLLR